MYCNKKEYIHAGIQMYARTYMYTFVYTYSCKYACT